MSQLNIGFHPDSESVSLGDLPSDGQYKLSPESIPPTSDQSIVAQSLNLDEPPRATNDKKYDNDLSSEQKVLDVEVKHGESFEDDNSYYSLKTFRERRRGNRAEDSGLSRPIRRFYKDQDELIDVYERMHNHGKGNEESNAEEKQKYENTQKMSRILTKVSFVANVGLFGFKLVGAIISKSLAVISSVVDSAVDVLTTFILFMAWRAIKKRDKYRYPEGRTRLEPIAIIILAVIMSAASVFVIYDSIDTIINDTAYFTEANTTKTLDEVDMSAFPIVVMIVTIIIKSILWFLCYRVDTPTMKALAADHRNDVFSNLVALFCGLIGSFAYKDKINQKAIFIDPIGAILISVYIIVMWIRQARDQIQRLTGYTADPKFLSHITWLTYDHSTLIKKIERVRAFYFGTSYLVEVHIVLQENMQLKEAHDIGESLQKKIEDLPDVELAFVHVDYEYDHNPSLEHKEV